MTITSPLNIGLVFWCASSCLWLFLSHDSPWAILSLKISCNIQSAFLSFYIVISIPLLCSISSFHSHQMLALRPFLMTAVPSPSEIVVHQAPLGTKENQIYWSLFQILLLLFCGCFWNGVFLCRPDLSGLELGDLALLKVCTTTLGPRSILFLIMWLCVGIFVWVLMPSEAKERV